MKIIPLLLAATLLCACAPKYNYTKADLGQTPLPSDVVVIYDYLAVVDDVGKRWDYKQDDNDQNIDKYGRLISELLRAHGYQMSEQGLVSSGLGLSNEIEFDYYVDGDKQENPITPPFKVQASGFTEDEVGSIVNLSDELIRVAGSTAVDEETIDQLAQADFSNLLDELTIPGDALILLLRLNEPSVSFTKSFGVALMTAAVSGAATGGSYITSVSLSGRPSAYAFLINASSGELIWKNFIPYVDKRYYERNVLFEDFPNRFASAE